MNYGKNEPKERADHSANIYPWTPISSYRLANWCFIPYNKEILINSAEGKSKIAVNQFTRF